MGIDLLSLRLKQYKQGPFDIGKYLINKLVAGQSTFEKNFFFFIYRPPRAMFDRFIADFDDAILNVRNIGLEFMIMVL